MQQARSEGIPTTKESMPATPNKSTDGNANGGEGGGAGDAGDVCDMAFGCATEYRERVCKELLIYLVQTHTHPSNPFKLITPPTSHRNSGGALYEPDDAVPGFSAVYFLYA